MLSATLAPALLGLATTVLAAGAVAPEERLAMGGGSAWVLLVSVLEWKDGAFTPFPKEDRRDALLYRHFTRDRGVPPDHIVWLKDSEATMRAIRKGLARLLKRSKPRDSLFLYYAGHGSREKPGATYFVPYDAAGGRVAKTSWAVPDIVAAIEAGFKGDRAILAADCCHSGGLCKQTRQGGSRVSYACLASAQSSSSSTGEWTFTDALLRGLTGSSRVDRNGDKAVTFGELAEHVESEMSFAERQLSASAVTGALTPDMKLASVSYSEPPPPARVSVRWKDGVDYRATVLGECTTGDGKPGRKVHYAGYKDTSDECAALDALSPFSSPKRKHADGADVFVSWDGTWYSATVTGFKLGLYEIHYDGWTGYWDEWVDPGRIKPARQGAPGGLP